MTCSESRLLLDALVDDELDLRSGLELETHLAGCLACRQQRESLMALKAQVPKESLRFEPPATLQPRLARALRTSTGGDRPTRLRRAWPLLIPATAAATLVIALPLTRPSPSDHLRDEVISAHVRSLLADHLTDVTSTDQHTVKPWFQGKVDYAVPVHDFASEGFALTGGRLDYLDGHAVAALVYRLRQHSMNAFVWPSTSADEPPRNDPSRGYASWRWTQGGLTWWLVTDVSGSDPERLITLLRAAH